MCYVPGHCLEAYRGTTGVNFFLVGFNSRFRFIDSELVQLIRTLLGRFRTDHRAGQFWWGAGVTWWHWARHRRPTNVAPAWHLGPAGQWPRLGPVMHSQVCRWDREPGPPWTDPCPVNDRWVPVLMPGQAPWWCQCWCHADISRESFRNILNSNSNLFLNFRNSF